MPWLCITSPLDSQPLPPIWSAAANSQITELPIIEDYPAHNKINPPPGHQTTRAGPSLRKCSTHGFHKESWGIGHDPTPDKCHQAGIYFYGSYSWRQIQPFFFFFLILQQQDLARKATTPLIYECTLLNEFRIDWVLHGDAGLSRVLAFTCTLPLCGLLHAPCSPFVTWH